MSESLPGDDGSMPSAPAPCDESAPASLGWLLEMLQEAMTGVMAGDDKPLQKANAVARLGNLYLRAYRTAELKQTNKQLTRQIAALEERLAAAEARAADHEPGTGEETVVLRSIRTPAETEAAGPSHDASIAPSTTCVYEEEPPEMLPLAAAGPSRASP